MIFIIECFQANYIVFTPEDRLNININLRIHDVPIQKVYTTKSPRVKLVSQLTRKMPYEYTWWRHQMETFSALLAICAGNSTVPVEFPTQRPVTLSFDVYFDLRPNKRLSKQSWGWWFETLSWSLWRHCNDMKEFITMSWHLFRSKTTLCNSVLINLCYSFACPSCIYFILTWVKWPPLPWKNLNTNQACSNYNFPSFSSPYVAIIFPKQNH